MEFQPFLVLQELWESPGAPRDFLAAFFLLFFLKAESKICVFGIFLAFFLLFSPSPRPRAAPGGGSRSMERFWAQTLQILGVLEGKFHL